MTGCMGCGQRGICTILSIAWRAKYPSLYLLALDRAVTYNNAAPTLHVSPSPGIESNVRSPRGIVQHPIGTILISKRHGNHSASTAQARRAVSHSVLLSHGLIWGISERRRTLSHVGRHSARANAGAAPERASSPNWGMVRACVLGSVQVPMRFGGADCRIARLPCIAMRCWHGIARAYFLQQPYSGG